MFGMRPTPVSRSRREAPARTIELLKDDGHRRALGQAGRRRAVALFGADRIVSQYERYYESVLGSRPAGS